MLEALKAVAERVKSGEISEEQGIKEVESISPKYAELIQKLNVLGPAGWMLLFTIVQTILAGLQTLKSDDAQKIVDAITQQLLL